MPMIEFEVYEADRPFGDSDPQRAVVFVDQAQGAVGAGNVA